MCSIGIWAQYCLSHHPLATKACLSYRSVKNSKKLFIPYYLGSFNYFGRNSTSAFLLVFIFGFFMFRWFLQKQKPFGGRRKNLDLTTKNPFNQLCGRGPNFLRSKFDNLGPCSWRPHWSAFCCCLYTGDSGFLSKQGQLICNNIERFVLQYQNGQYYLILFLLILVSIQMLFTLLFVFYQ